MLSTCYQTHRSAQSTPGKTTIDCDDVKLAIQSKVNFSFSQPPPREGCWAAVSCNRHDQKPLSKPEVVPKSSRKDSVVPPKSLTAKQVSSKHGNINSYSSSSNKNKKILPETASWVSLPSNLLTPGKSMLRRRNLASLVVVEAQKEASFAISLVKCLSLFADLCSSASSENHHLVLAKFFTLQEQIDQLNPAKPLTKKPFQSSPLPLLPHTEKPSKRKGVIQENKRWNFTGNVDMCQS